MEVSPQFAFGCLCSLNFSVTATVLPCMFVPVLLLVSDSVLFYQLLRKTLI